MSITKEQIIKDFESESEYLTGESKRLKPGALDEHYIRAFLDNPFQSQRKNLQAAMGNANVEGKATTQRAYEIHSRLRDKIDRELVKLASDAKAMGLKKLIKLLDADSESVQAQVATTLTKSVFPDVQITKDQSMTDLDRLLEENQREIEQLTGTTEH